MGCIYKITNQINGKSYIGKTNKNIEERLKEHKKERKKDRSKNRPLYRAMNKYGVDNFIIEKIEETNNPEEREIYWINYYNTYHHGYNATKGGDGKPFLDYNRILERIKEFPYASEVAKEFNCCTCSIRRIARDNNIVLKNFWADKKKKEVIMFSINNEEIKRFYSVSEAANFIKKPEGASHIAAACRGERRSVYGYRWSYTNLAS